MVKQRISFRNKDNMKINVYKWAPSDKVKGVVQIAHGMAEHAGRYEYFAKALVREGFVVYAHDHRGHGRSAYSIEELGYISDDDGFKDMVLDMKCVTGIARSTYPDLPVILFSHSMGSFLAQHYIQLYGDEIDGVILSGTNGKQPPIVHLGILLSKLIMKARGRKFSGKLLDALVFGSYNKKVIPVKTRFDWLSRDEKQVAKYIEDPYCGTTFPVSFFHDFLVGTTTIHEEMFLRKIPKNLPVYIFGGDCDPVSNYGKGIMSLTRLYESLGLTNITAKLYSGGRHEMLNELNRDQVIEDIIKWTRQTGIS